MKMAVLIVDLLKDYEKGISIHSLSIKYKITRYFIRKHLRASGINFRTYLEQAKITAKSNIGSNHPNWKGGRHFNKRLKEFFISIDGKYRKESHYTWCINNDMHFIPKGFDIHHKNLNHLDNTPMNLILVPHDLHASFHRKLLSGEIR